MESRNNLSKVETHTHTHTHTHCGVMLTSLSYQRTSVIRRWS